MEVTRSLLRVASSLGQLIWLRCLSRIKPWGLRELLTREGEAGRGWLSSKALVNSPHFLFGSDKASLERGPIAH